MLELPAYRLPRAGALARHVWRRVRAFLTEAGTVILAVTVVLWGLFNFPRSGEAQARLEADRVQITQSIPAGEARDAALARVEGEAARARLEYSVAGRLGHALEPALAQLAKAAQPAGTPGAQAGRQMRPVKSVRSAPAATS